MGRPPKANLYTINPEQLASEVVEAVEAHVVGLASMLGMAVTDVDDGELFASVRSLAQYAVHGGRLDAPVSDYMMKLFPLWSRPVDCGGMHEPEFDDPDSVNPVFWIGQLVLVMRGAHGREQLERGESISPAELAVLGGMSARNLRALLRSGEIAGNDDGRRWLIPAAEAKRWLEMRKAQSDG